MGQAAVLPDPADEASNSITTTDDLLSQLAGEEIDRLLAESEADAVSCPLSYDSPPDSEAERESDSDALATAAAADVEALAREVEASLNAEATAAASESSVAPVGAAPPPQSKLAAAEMDSAISKAVDESAPTATDVTVVASSPAASTAVQPSTPVLEENPQERAALHADMPAAESPALQPEPDDQLPLYLKPLAWINAPLEAFPEAFRESLGKVAIITLMNALAVLIYVVMFRGG